MLLQQGTYALKDNYELTIQGKWEYLVHNTWDEQKR
jgi:hypothetical protein